MKQFAIAIAMLLTVGLLSEESQAQHFHYGRGFRGPVTSGFSFSVGNGFNGISYSNFRGGFAPIGGFNPAFRSPIYRAPIYNYGFGRPVYGGGFYNGVGGFSRPGCGRW